MRLSTGWLLAAVVASGCGNDTGADSARIGAAGGMVETDGATLVIPPGALDKEVEITIVSSAQVAPAGYLSLSPIFEFEPSGLEFAVPAEVRIAFDGAADPSIVWSRRDGNGFEMLVTSHSGGLASAGVLHFSRGFAGYSDGSVDAGPCDGGEILCDGLDNDCDESTPDDACPQGQSCDGGVCAEVCGFDRQPCCAGNVCFRGGSCVQPGNICSEPV